MRKMPLDSVPSWLMWSLGAGVCIFSSLVFMLYKHQSRLLYFPQFPEGSNLRYDATPADYNLGYEDCYLNTSDGAVVHLWLIKQLEGASHKPTIVMFHGNAGNIAHRLPHARHIHNKCAANVVLVSYRGYGLSKGVPSQEGFTIDARTVLEHLSNRTDIDKDFLVLYGSSIGGAVSIGITFLMPTAVRALILENTFTHIGDMVDVVMPLLRSFKSLISNPWPSKDLIGDITAPILFVSGRADELVPSWMMDQLYQLASKSRYRKMFHVNNGTHNDTWARGGLTYYQEINDFLARVAQLQPPHAPAVTASGVDAVAAQIQQGSL